ncbi:hypothetical protein KG112_14755 [Nocardioides sp. zg-ZUI104]|uniref:hypothetical protein n=1 Tax=Nocardioides faecalis TaxID=2803858 RepID=UPI001BD0EB0D|nr:hypothetical protein [Nocardioides faecalis]MBS4754072.1 hypothetical protein [Nocardioides faecalis]
MSPAARRRPAWATPGRLLLAVLTLALVVAAVVWLRPGQADDPFAAYCEEVVERREDLGAALGAGKETGLLRALPSFERLAEKSPKDLRDEWAIVVERVSALRDALEAAGVDPASYDPEDPPQDLSDDELAAIRTAAVRLAAAESRAAFAGVAQQARDVCKTPLSL